MKRSEKILAALSYFCILVLVPLLSGKRGFVRYHAKQGIVHLLLWVIVPFVLYIPIVGPFLGVVLVLFNLVLWFFGIVHVVRGEKKPLPIVGEPVVGLLY